MPTWPLDPVSPFQEKSQVGDSQRQRRQLLHEITLETVVVFF